MYAVTMTIQDSLAGVDLGALYVYVIIMTGIAIVSGIALSQRNK